MNMNFKLDEKGFLKDKYIGEVYTFSTNMIEHVTEVVDGVEFDVVYLVTRYYFDNGVHLKHREEIERTEIVKEVPTVESIIGESKTLVDLITSLRSSATTLIEGLPLKNATQREYALMVALTNEAFAKEFVQLPEKFKDLVIQ